MTETFLIYIFIAFTGLFFGSFLNVLADRLSFGKTILGRSMCESCHHVLAWNDLIPVISYTLLNGKCRYCKASISIQYPLSEIFTAVMFVLTYYLSLQSYNQFPLHIIHVLIAAILVVMILSDLRYQILPDEMQIALIIVSLVRLYVLFQPTFASVDVKLYAIGALGVPLPLLLVFLFSKGRGMGFGDVKYAVSMGLLLGIWNGLIALYLAFIIGGLVGGAVLLLRKGSMKTKIAFGPFLFLGTYLMLFYEADIILILSRIYRF